MPETVEEEVARLCRWTSAWRGNGGGGQGSRGDGSKIGSMADEPIPLTPPDQDPRVPPEDLGVTDPGEVMREQFEYLMDCLLDPGSANPEDRERAGRMKDLLLSPYAQSVKSQNRRGSSV